MCASVRMLKVIESLTTVMVTAGSVEEEGTEERTQGRYNMTSLTTLSALSVQSGHVLL